MRLVIARCSVDYVGRLSAHLPTVLRLLMCQAGMPGLIRRTVGGSVSAAAAKIGSASGPLRTGRRLAIAAVILAAGYLAAIGSTHSALAGGSVGWSGTVPGKSLGLGPITPAERARGPGPTPGYSNVLWATRPGGEVSFGFELHNGGLVPVTVLGLRLHSFGQGVIHDVAPVGALLGPGKFGNVMPFHPVTIGPGGSVPVGLTLRVVCDPTVRLDAHLPDQRGDASVLGDAASPVVVHYRALGVSGSQTLSLGGPLLVAMPYTACK